MKNFKYVLFGLVLMVAGQVYAETTIPWTKEGCESVKGTWITAHSATDEGCDAAHCNGKNFCRSAQQMNWWSALIWCKALGRELTDLETACPNGLSSGNVCPNLDGFRKVLMWTSTPGASNKSYMIHSNATGPIWNSYNERSIAYQNYALCK